MSNTPAAKEKGAQVEEGSGKSAPPATQRRRPSLSPAPRRGRSPSRRGGGELVVRESVVRESTGSANYPTLTRSNYAEWAMVMRVQLQAQHLWDVIEYGTDEDGDDRAALAALLRAVPPELVRTLAVKDCAKTAWETIKTMRLGCERVREAKAQTRRREWEELRFKSGESIEDFAIRLTAIVNDLELLGDPIDEYKAVLKFLRVVPKKYRMIAMAIEQTVRLRDLTIEELTGRFTTAEEGYELDDATEGVGKLLLTEEEWAARQRQRGQGSSSAGDKGGKGTGKPKPQSSDKAANSVDGSGERRKGNCRYCGKPGHWAKECRKAKRDRDRGIQGATANLAQVEEEEAPGLLMAQVCTLVHAANDASETVYRNEDRVIPVPSPEGIWYLDNGASSHMTGVREMFTSLDESVHGTVRFGDGSIVSIKGRGTVVFVCLTGDHRVLGDVYYIPSLKSNIISLGQLDENGCKITIEGGVMSILDRPRKVLARVGRTGNRLYTVRLILATPVSLLLQKDDGAAWLWHGRYGHLHFRALRTLARKGLARGVPEIDHVEEFCDGCALGKQHRLPFPQASTFRAKKALELVHTDLCGPITPPTSGGRKYFILIVDDHTRYMWLELLRSKDEALSFFKKVKATAEVERECKLIAFRSDRGGEFNSRDFIEFCEANCINHQTTAPYTPQQNGVVERRNRTVVEMARCLLKAMKVPGAFWGEAVKTAVYLLNRAPSRSLEGVTPYEAWHGKKPNVQHLKIFGCVAHVKKLGPGVDKLADRSVLGIFVGYEVGSKAYRVYDPITKRLHVTRDVIFEERCPWDWEACGGARQLARPTTFTVVYSTDVQGSGIMNQGVAASSVVAEDSAYAPSASASVAASPAEPVSSEAQTPTVEFATPLSHDDRLDTDAGGTHRYSRIDNLIDTTMPVMPPVDSDTGDDGSVADEAGLCLLAAEELGSLDEALEDPLWRKAMQEELDAIVDNGTWEPTELLAGHRAIGLKWVYKVKKDPDGNVVKHKARLVAKGYA
uniref:Uncharacterized protein n=1 Tax=Avena sativa TaxID=4498 RepID=A0ACD6A031_AVESA